VLKLEIRAHIVLNFYIMKPSQLAEAPHFAWHAHKPLEDIEVVQTLVEQNSASLALPGGAPSATGVVRFRPKPIGHDPIHANYFAQLAALYHLTDFEVTRLSP